MVDGSCSLEFMKQGVAFDVMPGSKMRGRCLVCCERHFGDCGEVSKQDANIDDVLHGVQHIAYKRNCSMLSKSSRMSQNFVPTYVYQRREGNKKSPSFFEIFSSAAAKASNACDSSFTSGAPLLDAKERAVSVSERAVSVPERAAEGVRSTVAHLIQNSKVATSTSNEFRALEEADSEEALTTDVDRILNDCNAKDHCSSSKSNRMSQNFVYVYQRREDNKKSPSFFEIFSSAAAKASNVGHSAFGSESPLLDAKEHAVSVPERAAEGVRSIVEHPVENSKLATASSNEFCAVEEAGSEEALTSDVEKILNDCNAKDHCSSSKLTLELSSPVLKVHTDDAGKCSSSGALIAGKVPEEISERDACISILRSQGVLDRVWARRDGASNEKSNKYCSKSCKVCEQRDSSKNMLICDNCDDAFHTSCYNPRITVLPLSEWLCGSCLKKKHKILNDKSTSNNLGNTGTEMGINRFSTSELELGSLEFMFTDTEPYMSNVRVGNEFQADVPDWCGPVDEDCNYFGDVLEVDTSSNIDTQDKDAINSLKHSPIGNWIQCHEVIEGVGEGIDGTVCGKWRRAPLFEVQTDNWECFRCILWDPTRADCAAPQELETEEVMKQLKYVAMLRPRLAAKKRKLECSKASGSQDRRGYDKRRR